MDKSTDSIITNTFEKRIKAAGNTAREFKSAQMTSGAGGLLSYKLENDVEWDRIETLPYVDPNMGNGIVELTITYVGDGTQLYPFAFTTTDLRVNGTADANKVRFDTDMLSWTYGAYPSSNIQATIFDEPDISSFTSDYQLKWKIYFFYAGTITYYVKLRARGTSPGTISIARTL